MKEKNLTGNSDNLKSKSGGALQGRTDREKKIMNVVVNTSTILLGTLMGGLTEAMMNVMGSVASGMAGAVGGEEAGEKVGREFKQKLPGVNEKMKAMIADARKDLYVQIEHKRKEIEPFLSDPVFDVGPKKIDEYDFKLPKLTEELDDGTIAQYIYLLVSEDPSFAELFDELTSWMNNLPTFTSKSEKK